MSDLITRNVFIDASIFRREGFNLMGHKLKALRDLGSDGRIDIFLTEVTLKETEFLLDENLEEIKELYLKLQSKVKPFECYLTEPILNIIRLEQPTGISNLVRLAFQEYLNDSNLTVLPVSEVDVSKVFDSYFGKKPPFGAGKKKAEFPDAFSLLSLENWCEQENAKMYVISTDADMEAYCCNSSRLHHLLDLSQFLNLISLEDNSIADKVSLWYAENHDFLLSIVQESLKERIENRSISVEDLSEILISVLDVELGQNIYSTYFSGSWVYAYCQAKVTFEAKGSYPRFHIQKQLGSSWERKVDEYVDFEARWTVSCEIEVELGHQLQEELMYSEAWVLGDIKLKLEEADKLIAI